MDKHFMRSYTQLLIQTCHKRKAHAMGGMSAFIPIKNDEMANNAALDAVKKDKMREVKDGHDGTWVAHPGLVEMTRKIFDEYMPTKNQINNKREDVSITANDLLQTPQGERTEDDIRKNINVSLQYINSWLSGTGCVPINNLMEDAATVEISRALIWQWIKFKVKTDSGIIVSKEKIQKLLLDEVAKLKTDKNIKENNETFKKAIEIFSNVSMNTSNFNNFLTTDAYEELIKISQT
jgi:malate synthase